MHRNINSIILNRYLKNYQIKMKVQAVKQTSIPLVQKPDLDTNMSERPHNLSKNGRMIMKQSLSPEKTPRNLGSSHYSKSRKDRSRGPQNPGVGSIGLGESQVMQAGAFATPIVRSPVIDNRGQENVEKQNQMLNQVLADLNNSPATVKNQMDQVIQNIQSIEKQLAHHEFQNLGQPQNVTTKFESLEQSSSGNQNAKVSDLNQGDVQIVPDIEMVKNYAEGYQNLYKGQVRQHGDLKLPDIIDSTSFFNGPSATSRRASSLHYQDYQTVNDGNRSGLRFGTITSTNRSVLNNQQSALSRIKDGSGSVLDILRETDREFKQRSRHLKIESETQTKLNKTIRTERLFRLNRSVIDKFDRLNPQNALANQTLQQKILGNASKVAFDLRPKYIEANRPQMEGCKQPVADGKCRTMLRIMGNFREELYGSSLQYQPDGSVGPAPSKKPEKPKKLSKGPSSIRDYRLASMSTLAREALDLEELRQLQEYGERHNIIEVSATSLMNDTGFTSIKQKLHTYLSPERLKRKSQTSLTMLATHQTANRKVNPLDRSFEGDQGVSEGDEIQKASQRQAPSQMNKFQTLEPEKSSQLPNITTSAIPSFNANQSVQQFHFGDKKIDGKIDRMNTTNYLGMAQSAVQGRASPLIASKLMKSYFDKRPGDPRGQTMRGNSLGFGQSSALAAFNLTSSSNAFVRKPGAKTKIGHFEEFQRKIVTFNSPNPIADKKLQKKQKLAMVEVRDKALLAAYNTTNQGTIEGDQSPSQSVAQPGTAIQQVDDMTDLNQTVLIKTKSNKKDTRRSQGSQKSIVSSKMGMTENARGLKLNASSALQIDEGSSTKPPIDGGTQLITEEVVAAIGLKPDVKGIDEPSGEPANDVNHESNEDLQIAPIEPNIQTDQNQVENDDHSPSVNTAVFQGTNSRNLNPVATIKPSNNSGTTGGDTTTFNSKIKGGKSVSKSPDQKRAAFVQRKKPNPNTNFTRLQHLTEKTEDKLGTNRLKQIYILNQAASPQYKLANPALQRESAGTSSNALETATVGSVDSPSKKGNSQRFTQVAANNQLQFQVKGQQKPVASMMTWFQGQQQQLRQKKQATARQRMIENQSTLKPTSNYPTSQTIDYLSVSGTQTKGQRIRPKILVPAGELPFEEAQFETVQTSMRRDESRYSPGIPTQLVTPPRNNADYPELAQIQQTQSNEYLLKSVGTQRQSPNISPQSKPSSRQFDHQTGQSFRSQEKSPQSGHHLPTVFPAPENIQQAFPKKNSLAKWEPSGQQSQANIAQKSPPRQQLEIKGGVTEEDSVTQNLTTMQQQDSSGNLRHNPHLRSFAPRLFDSSINLNKLSEAIRSPKVAAGEPEKVFIINEEEKQRILTLKNMPEGLRKHLRNHKRQATIQQQLSRRNQMSRIDVVFQGEPKRLSQHQIHTESGQAQSFSTNHQNSGPIYMLDNQAQQPPGSQSSTLDGHILVQVQHPLNQSSRANISMTHHLPQALPIPNGQKFRIDKNMAANNQNGVQVHSVSGQHSRSPIDHWNHAPALQAMSSLAQLMPGQIKEIEVSSEGGDDHRDGNLSPGETHNSKHIVQVLDSNKNLVEGLGPQSIEQLMHLQSLQSLGINNQNSTNNITENLSNPGSRQKRRDRQQPPVVNFIRTDANKVGAQKEMAQTQSKVNVVNLDLKLSRERNSVKKDDTLSQTHHADLRKSSIQKRKEKDPMNESSSKLNRNVSNHTKQRQEKDLEDDESLRKGTVIVDRDSINSSPSHGPNDAISKSKFPRNQSLISSMKLDYTLRGKQIEQGLQPNQQNPMNSTEQIENQKLQAQDGQLPQNQVHVITSQVGNAKNIKSVPHGSETSPTHAKEQSVTAQNAQDAKKSISISPIKDPAQKAQIFDTDKQNMSQTMPEKWNGAITGEGMESTQQLGLSPSNIASSPVKDDREQGSSSVTGNNPTSRLTVLTEQEDVIHAPMQLPTQIISGEVGGFADRSFQEKSPRNRKLMPQLGMTQTVLNKDILAPESPKGQHRGMPKPKQIKRKNLNRGATNTKKTTVFNNQMIRDLNSNI